MKNTYISIIVLVILVAGAVFILAIGKKAEAPWSNVSNVETPLIGAVKEFTVTGKNFSFTPSLINVKKGDRVKITFKNESGFHDFRIDEFGIATPQKQSPDTEVLEFIVNEAGSFEYYCSVGTHRQMGMKGTLVVQSS